MALSTPFVGSGEFVPETEWSCPDHDEPQIHECDCGHCDIPYYTCEGCAHASWVDKRDEDGNVVTRELSTWEVGFRRLISAEDARAAKKIGALERMLADPSGRKTKIVWIEDELLPKIPERRPGTPVDLEAAIRAAEEDRG